MYLNIKTEYSFKKCFGKTKDTISLVESRGFSFAGIADLDSTWGHVNWKKECANKNIKPIFGVTLMHCENAKLKEKQFLSPVACIAKNNNGLQGIYELVELSTNEEHFYYQPRIDVSDLNDFKDDVIFIFERFSDKSPHYCYQGLCPSTVTGFFDINQNYIPLIDNRYLHLKNKPEYDFLSESKRENKSVPSHLMTYDEFLFWQRNLEQKHFDYLSELAESCQADLPKAKMVSFSTNQTVESICIEGAKNKSVDLNDPIYKARFEREIKLIKEKNFVDYFLVIWDLIKFAKEKMIVGPGRGSSAGSLVCHLMDITDVDPIEHDLLFERFIDVNRQDMPDIDIDFPDGKAYLVEEYLIKKYGKDRVAQLGAMSKLQSKSVLVLMSRELDIPRYVTDDLRESMIERSKSHPRFDRCYQDSLESTEAGKELLKIHPSLKNGFELENHADHTTKHAAGLIVTDLPIRNYCSVDSRNGCAQIDKDDAEELDILKIDALRLRTLTIIQDCLDQINKPASYLNSFSLEDEKAFDVLNNDQFAGVFQFEGDSVKRLCRETTIVSFSDICSISAIARPGPLEAGGDRIWLANKHRNLDDGDPHVISKMLLPIIGKTHGVIIYQEQVMRIVRELGLFSESDTSKIRRAVGKSKGEELIETFFEKFKSGCKKNGIEEETARVIFQNIVTFGAYGFNKSHAVAYGRVTHWCLVLKAYHPLEWALACLRHPGTGDDANNKCLKILRELDKRGIKYKPFDPKLSKENWSLSNGLIIGGLTNIKGIASKTAKAMVSKIEKGQKVTPRQQKLLDSGQTPFDMLYESKELFPSFFQDPGSYNVVTEIKQVSEILDEEGEFLIIGKIISKKVGNVNEPQRRQRRIKMAKEKGQDIGDGFLPKPDLFLNIKIEDDEGESMYVRIGRHEYLTVGRKINQENKEGDWFLFKGFKYADFGMLFASRVRFVGNKEKGLLLKKRS